MAKTDESTPLRRSTRVNLQIPVTVSGTFPNGKVFREETFLLSVSKFGAKLRTALPLEVGTQIKIQPQKHSNSALFRVVWTGREGSPRAGEVGVEYLEVSNLLGVAFPE